MSMAILNSFLYVYQAGYPGPGDRMILPMETTMINTPFWAPAQLVDLAMDQL